MKTNFSIDLFEAECCDFTECRWEPLCDRRNTSDYDLDLDDHDLNYDRGVDPIGHIDEEKTTRHYLDEDELFPWMVGAGILLGIIIILLSICLIWCHYNQRKLGKFSKISTRFWYKLVTFIPCPQVEDLNQFFLKSGRTYQTIYLPCILMSPVTLSTKV